MKKNIIITMTLIFLAAAGMNVHAQQQKPSERSFAAEVSKIKEKQAARNRMSGQMQQPAGNTSVPADNSNPGKTVTAPGTITGTTTAQPAVGTQSQGTKNKPSSGPMRQPHRPGAQ